MNIINLRKKPRRTLENRRTSDRRAAAYEFGSPEWIEYARNSYTALPKEERRTKQRRSDERRHPDRRQPNDLMPESKRPIRKVARVILSQAELKLIEDVYLNALDE